MNYDISDDADEAFYQVKSYTVEIDGKTYTYETIKSQGYFSGINYYVYDSNGNLCVCGDEYDNLIIINKLTYNFVPSAFNQPSGYTVVDLDEE
jgi:hypothetical protein